jgi:beta-carotene hydroxylase
MNVQTPVAVDAAAPTSAALRAQEKAIAEKYIGGTPWLMIFWGLANVATWFALWPLTMRNIVPLWLAFPIATFCVTMSYLPSHDAQHDIIVPRSSRWHWLNELFGHVVIFPLGLPFRTARTTHLQHHRHTNDPVLDCDYHNRAPDAFAAIINTIRNRQPGSEGNKRYGNILMAMGTPAAKAAMIDAVAMNLFILAAMCALAWSGYAIEVALLWWLPRILGTMYILFYLSWAPHHPTNETGRYRETRAFRSIWGNLGSSGMQYHIVHHLYPNIRLNWTPRAYRDLRPILEARGCDLGGLSD